MDALPPPLAFFVLLFAGWVNRPQQAVIDDLLEEDRVLRAAQPSRRLRLSDDQRRRLAVKGNVVGRSRLASIAASVTRGTPSCGGIAGLWSRNTTARRVDVLHAEVAKSIFAR
jgi:hypothetical protein